MAEVKSIHNIHKKSKQMSLMREIFKTKSYRNIENRNRAKTYSMQILLKKTDVPIFISHKSIKHKALEYK